MTVIAAAWAYLKDRLAQAAVQIGMMALGVALVAALLVFAAQYEQQLVRNTGKVEVVIGAKGSPLQLVLSSVHHNDIPTGNIDYETARRIMRHPALYHTIPLALGDSYRGFRIVGTKTEFLLFYGMSLAEGRPWQTSMEAVIGSHVAQTHGLQAGDRFVGSHGLAEGGKTHDAHVYEVVGVLKPGGTVRDRLIFTSLESVWQVHGAHAHGDAHNDAHNEAHDDGHGEGAHDHHHDDSDHAHDASPDAAHTHEATREITAILGTYRQRAAATSFPRYVNQQTKLMAASPALQMARLNQLVGGGTQTLLWFGTVIAGLALLSVVVGIYAALRERRYDLAVLRLQGVPPRRLLQLMLAEGMTISVIGIALGYGLGHGVVEALGRLTAKGAEIGLTGMLFPTESAIALGLMLAACGLACLLPALQVYRLDIRRQLQRGSR